MTLTAELCDSCAGPIRLPLTITGTTAGETLKTRVVHVSFGEQHDPGLLNLVHVDIQTNDLPTLVITADNGAL